MRPCHVVDLGRRAYRDCWELQRWLVRERQAGRIPDTLLFVEHPATYTVGRAGSPEHVLASPETLEKLGAELIETDRGGDVTFHGPGQLVGYPILSLADWRKDVHLYLRCLEESLILALRSYGIEAYREPGLTGVWHPGGKLAAIGVRVSRWVTSHGFALNVATDLDYFKHIVPCGIVERKVSSMEDILGEPVAPSRVEREVAERFADVFTRELTWVRESELQTRVD
jgi:lipoate-protein ligase B